MNKYLTLTDWTYRGISDCETAGPKAGGSETSEIHEALSVGWLSLESFLNRADIYRKENQASPAYQVGEQFYLGHLLDAAKLTKRDLALIKAAAGGALEDETAVTFAMLELADINLKEYKGLRLVAENHKLIMKTNTWCRRPIPVDRIHRHQHLHPLCLADQKAVVVVFSGDGFGMYWWPFWRMKNKTEKTN